MIKDSEANDKLVETTISLAENASLQRELSENISRLAIKNADEVIAREIIEAVGA
jgi:UDP-N-acetylglucosamine--N-acetylmuramyl-(pentapeptide) pyrophosphoryl-undecaprenol N-acetylglucosamine transferase